MSINQATQTKCSIALVTNQTSDHELPDAEEHMGWILSQDTEDISFTISQGPLQGDHYRFVTMSASSNATSCDVEGTILHPGDTGVFVYYNSDWYGFRGTTLKNWAGFEAALSGNTTFCLKYKATSKLKITRFRAETSSGTVDATIEVEGVDTVGVDDEGVSSTPLDVVFTSNDGLVDIGDTVLLQFTNLSSPLNLYYQIDYQERV
jgi:hypothetical protein